MSLPALRKIAAEVQAKYGKPGLKSLRAIISAKLSYSNKVRTITPEHQRKMQRAKQNKRRQS